VVIAPSRLKNHLVELLGKLVMAEPVEGFDGINQLLVNGI
jgi:hypothetical protein